MEILVLKMGEAGTNGTPSAYLKRARAGEWRASASRIIACDLAVAVNYRHEIVAVGKITGVLKASGDKVKIAMDNDEASADLLGKVIDVGTSQNPVGYLSESALLKAVDKK